MKIHHGKFNDQYHLASKGENSPLNIDMAGHTRPNSNYSMNFVTPQAPTLSYYQMEYVLSGKIYIQLENETYCAEKGDFFFIKKATPRRLYSDADSPAEKLYVTPKGPLADGIVSAYNLKGPVIIVKADVEKYFRKILKILEDAPSYTFVERDKIGREILAIVQEVSAKLNPETRESRRYIAENIMQFIDDNITSKFKIEDLCRKFFLGKTQIIKLFKEKYGITPMKYAQLRRIDIAKYYLTNTDEPISSLHDKLGFDDIKYFSKLFKKSTGYSPSSFKDKFDSLRDMSPAIHGKFYNDPLNWTDDMIHKIIAQQPVSDTNSN